MGDREKGRFSIREALEQKDVSLYKRIEYIWEKAREIQERQQSKESHQQGPLHCEKVEENLGKIISDDEKLNSFSPLELFLLSVAACYHDAGKSDDFNEGHASVIMMDINSHPEKYHISDPEGKILSYIIGSHDIDEVFYDTPEIYPIGNEDINVRLLSSLFRLADVLHTDNSRIPHIIVGDPKKEDDKTRFRKLVKGWFYNSKSQIELTVAPENINDINIITKGVTMMQKQIECIVPDLRSEGYPYEIDYSCDIRIIKWKADKENKRTFLDMDFYSEEETNIFKGRDIEIEALLKKIIGDKITILIGNSGVGKTSLIRAGLFPILKKMEWECIWTRPIYSDQTNYILDDVNSKLIKGYKAKDILTSIKKLSEQSKYVIIAIDQFEDIIRLPQEIRNELRYLMLRVYGNSFKNIHILLSYRSDYEPEISTFIEDSSIRNPSRFPLLGLDNSGAIEALRILFESSNVGISEELLIKIIQELGSKSEYNKLFFPPFVQMVASSLIKLSKSNNNVITEQFYYNEAKSVENIIATYLINRLEEFGNSDSFKRVNAEKILKELVISGIKEQKRKSDFVRYLEIPEDEIQELLDLLVKKRLIRHLGDDNYEIIHDYLVARIEEMINDDERILKSIRDILRTKTYHFQFYPNPSLLEPNEMILLYSLKESIKPDNQEKELLMFSYLAGKGPAMWWFKEDEKSEYLLIISKAFSSPISKVRKKALEVFKKIANHEDLYLLGEMLNNQYEEVQHTAIRLLKKIDDYNDLDGNNLLEIKKLIKNSNNNIRYMALDIFIKLATRNDFPTIKELLKDRDQNIRRNTAVAFCRLITKDDLLEIKWVLSFSDQNVKKIVAETFSNLFTSDNLPEVIEMLKDPNLGIRNGAEEAFNKIITLDDLPLIKDMIKDQNPNIRYVAVKAFKNLNARDILPEIIEMLNDQNSSVSYVAEEAFNKIITLDDLPFIKDMIKDQNSNMKRVAIEAFGKLGSYDTLPEIIEMLKDPNLKVRNAAEEAFLKLITLDNLPLLKTMIDDTNPDLKKVAIIAFGNLGSRDALPEIMKHFNNLNSNVKYSAKKTFQKLVTQNILIIDDFPTIKEILFCKNFPMNVRMTAANAFVKLCTHEDLPLIKDLLIDSDPSMKYAAMGAFNRVVIHDDLPTIKEMLKHPNTNVRIASIRALEKVGTYSDFPLIKKILKDPDPNVRKASIEAFEKLGTRDVLHEIKQMFWDSDKDIRFASEKTFNEIVIQNTLIHYDLPKIKEILVQNYPQTVKKIAANAFMKLCRREDFLLIKTMLKNSDPDVRWAATEAFKKIAVHSDLNLIKEMYIDEDPRVRLVASNVFHELINHNVLIHEDLSILKEMLSNNYPEDVRLIIAKTFEKLGTYDDLPVIKTMLNNFYPDVRMAAIEALEKIVSQSDLSIIKEMLDDSDPKIKLAAVRAFEKLGARDDLLIIRKMLEDVNSDVRLAAVKTFERLGTYEDLLIIKKMFSDPDFDVRFEAVKAFNKLSTHDNLPMIKEILKESCPNVIQVIFDIIENLIIEDDFLIKNKYEGLSQEIIQASKEFDTDQDLHSIINIFKGHNHIIKHKIVKLFEKFYINNNVLLKKILMDCDWKLIPAVFIIFNKMVTFSDMAIIKEMLNDSDPDIRRVALKAYERSRNEKDIQNLIEEYERDDIIRKEYFECIIFLDEKFYSPFDKI